jgi:hypothetical protein
VAVDIVSACGTGEAESASRLFAFTRATVRAQMAAIADFSDPALPVEAGVRDAFRV